MKTTPHETTTRNRGHLAVCAVLACLSTLNPQLSTVFAQGTAFTYQGRLADNGNAANGNYDLRFTTPAAGGNVVAGPITSAPLFPVRFYRALSP